jgi:riboflavin kinase/FMN adenylyltransferase
MASHAIDWHEEPPPSCRGGALSVGNFDGVHRGHAALLAELVRLARQLSGPAVVLTFEPHPLRLLRPDLAVPLLTTPAERAALLKELGADEVLIMRTTQDLLDLRAGEFFDRVLRGGLDVRGLVEGPSFAFGHNREGNLELLQQMCDEARLALSVVPPVVVDGAPVSSSRIRGELTAGNVRQAAQLLGRPYRISGVVSTGAGRGRTIGFPTANLEQVTTEIPGDGVYAVRARDPAGQPWPGAANIGPNPTFAEQQRKVEVHLIGFSGDLYGQPLTVDFLERLRDTRAFPGGAAELVEQLHRDVARARQIEREGRAPATS